MIRRRRGRRLFNQVEPVADGYRTTSWETSFTPTLEDVRAVRWLLASKPACSGAYLPNELVLAILDLARYHPITSSERKENSQLASHKPPYCYTGLYLVSGPVPIPKTGETLKIFDVRFTIQSRDQGWTTEANKTIQNSSSFFEASIIRSPDPGSNSLVIETPWDTNGPPEAKALPTSSSYFCCLQPIVLVERAAIPERSVNTDREPQWEGSHSWFLQANNMASKTEATHEIVWGREGEWEGGEGAGNGEGFVKKLQPGDRIAVWARATRGMWENHISSVKVDIRYTVL